MALHAAEQIVVAAKALLTGLTTTGTNVFDSRVYPMQYVDLPALKVDQGDETVDQGTVGDQLDRTMELIVIVAVKQNTGYRTEVNQIRKEVEIAFAGDQTLSGLCHYVFPASTSIELSGDADKPVAEATMTFSVRYFTKFSEPDIPLF